MSDDPFSANVQALLGLGVRPDVARGAINYMRRNESGLNPYAVNPTSGALGTAQWLGPRKDALIGQYGPNPTGGQQTQFMTSELQGPERATLAKLQQATGEKAGYDIWGSTYERPGSAALAKAGVPEGYYGGALHLNVGKQPPPRDDGSDDILRALIMNSMRPQVQASKEEEGGGLSLEELAKPQQQQQQQPSQQAPAEAPQQRIQPPALPSPGLGTEPVPSVTPPQPVGGPMPPPLEMPAAPAAPQQQAAPQQAPSGIASDPLLGSLLNQAVQTPQAEAPSQQAAASPITSDPLLSRILRQISPIGSAQAAERVEPPILRMPGAEIGGGAPAAARSPELPSSIGVQRPAQPPLEQPAQPPLTPQSIGPQPVLPARPPNVGSQAQGAVEQYVSEGFGGIPHTGPMGGATGLPHAAPPGGTTLPQPGPASVVTPGAAPPGQPPRQPPTGPPTPPPPPTVPPGRPSGGPTPRPRPTVVQKFREVVNEAKRDAQIKAVPMAAGEPGGQRTAKDLANGERLARHIRTTEDRALQKFSEKEQTEMWDAMDSASVAAQTSGYNEGAKIINRLPKAQQEALWRIENRGVELWERAREEGIVEPSAERLPFYVPRAVVDLSLSPGEMPKPTSGGGTPGTRNIDQPAANIGGRRMMGRSHLTVEETEAAAQTRLGANAQVVRNIRVLPYYYEQLEKTIIARRMMNELRQIGLVTGKPTVLEGSEGAGRPDFFTVPHPLFYTTRPQFTTDPVGKKTPLLDEHDNTVFERVPLYVSKQFEGPLRAIMRGQDGALYRGAMHAKGGAMSLIMNSPTTHNAVIWGKALPAMPGKMLTFHYYRNGEALLNDRVLMEQAVGDGLVPIGTHGYLQDIHGIAETPTLAPGRSLTAKGVGAVVESVGGQKAGDAIRRTIDKMGEFWHYKLLWKQVAKVQIGLYKDLRDKYIKGGTSSADAGKLAARAANNYVGALPNEAMSEKARKLGNVLLFSRSFTASNIGIIKDAVLGLPRDVQAQLGRSLTQLEQSTLNSQARRKAISVLLTDLALYYFTNAALESGLNVLRGDTSLGEEGQGYIDRMHKLINRGKENILDLYNPFADMLALTPQSEHEPQKQNRVEVGRQPDGTAVYARPAVGKIGEDIHGWLTTPIQMLINKEGTLVRPIHNLLTNDRGFGQTVYDKDPQGLGGMAKVAGQVLWEFVRTQLPEEQINALVNVIQGKASALDAGKIAAPAFGFSVSKGAPGGPEIGEMYAEKASMRERWKTALPEAKKLVEAGKLDEARQKLRDEKMPNHLIRYYMRIYQDPKRRLSPRALREFNRSASPEAVERMQRDRARGAQPPVQSPSYPWLPSLP